MERSWKSVLIPLGVFFGGFIAAMAADFAWRRYIGPLRRKPARIERARRPLAPEPERERAPEPETEGIRADKDIDEAGPGPEKEDQGPSDPEPKDVARREKRLVVEVRPEFHPLTN